MTKVTKYNETVAAIRGDAQRLLEQPEKFRRRLIEKGIPAAAVAKMPSILSEETATRLTEIAARGSSIEIDRERSFLIRACEEIDSAIDEFCSAWKACVEGAKIWDDLVASGHAKLVDLNGNPIPKTDYDKAVEAQRAKPSLKVVETPKTGEST